MRDTFLTFGAPLLGQEEVEEVIATLQSGWIGSGPRVARFERDFAALKGEGTAVAVSSCTAALHLSLLAAGLAPGDEVITSPMTFCATINAIIHAGATPVLADVDPITMNLDPAAVEAAITPRTRAILPVHFAGHPCDMDAFVSITRRHGLILIEDCAHAIETLYKGQHAGTFGDFGCFSFYVTKNVVTGEGGIVLARDEAHAARLKVMALHGLSSDAWKRFGDEGYKHYDVIECGFKYNMTDMQAALGIHQLARVESTWLRRKEIWEGYREALTDLPVELPVDVRDVGSRHAYHLFPVLLSDSRARLKRDELLTAMAEAKIGVGVHYRSVAEYSYYRERFGWNPHAWPVAMKIGRNTMSLPLSAKMTDDDLADVVSAVSYYLG
jgi:dTDP-4-amino-4,6-dideoxygalactose transaminase